MIINGNYYPQSAANNANEATGQVDPLASHMNVNTEEQSAKSASDVVQLSEEAYAALKEYAPESLQILGYDADNPVLDEMKEIAQEKYFHFGSGYVTIPETDEEMLSALDVANRYMDALNSIKPDEIYDAIAGVNAESAGSFLDAEDIYSARSYLA